MENKKGIYNTQNTRQNEPNNPATSKYLHQHNNPSAQNLRLLQYGLKVPNSHSHSQLNQIHKHQQLAHTHPHVHQHQVQNSYQATIHQHLQSPNQYSGQIPIVHQHIPQSKEYLSQKHQKNEFLENKPHQPLQLHSHNKLNLQNAQIWVPHQPPVHYNQQQQTKKEAQPQTQSINKSNAPVSKTKEVVERKKSTGSQLRSPTAKRPTEAPVTMQGWLYKQGSEGLMLWKKRWFVLSEYCLFYYKGKIYYFAIHF